MKSPFCMRELHEVWRTSKVDPALFKSRTRAFIIKGTPMRTALDRARCAAAWKARHAELDALAMAEGAAILGHSCLTELNAMARFATQTADILHAIADTIGVLDFGTFLAHGFAD